MNPGRGCKGIKPQQIKEVEPATVEIEMSNVRGTNSASAISRQIRIP